MSAETDTALVPIGDVAAMIGLSLRSIRYYEEVGLVVPARTSGGHRLYGAAHIDRLRMIMKMKPLDFSLDEMGGLLESLDAVRAGGRGERRARQALLMYRDVVEQRWIWLQERLEIAGDFRAQLDDELGGGR